MDPEHREWLVDFVKKARAAEEAVSKLLEVEAMGGRNAYHPTGNVKADGVRARTEGLIEYLRTETAAGGPLTQSAAASAIKDYEQAAFWAVKALTAADFVAGDDGGGKVVEGADGESDP